MLKGQVILRQKAYFGPDYYGRHFLIWCASFNRKISFSSLNFREGEAILPKCLSKGIVAQVSDNTSNISTLPAQHSWIWAKNKIPFNQVFPLHHTPSLESLQKSWVRKIFGLQPLGEKRKFCVTSFFILYDRPGEISEYFGLKIAFYFAWLGHYTTALSIPAVVGGGFWVGFLLNPLSDYLLQMFQFFFHGRAEFLEDIGFVLFSLFNVIWATFYLEVSFKIISNQPSFQNFRPGSVALQSFHTNGVASNPGVFITHYYGRHCLIQGWVARWSTTAVSGRWAGESDSKKKIHHWEIHWSPGRYFIYFRKAPSADKNNNRSVKWLEGLNLTIRPGGEIASGEGIIC